jgi:zinc transport system substrate-binding protein
VSLRRGKRVIAWGLLAGLSFALLFAGCEGKKHPLEDKVAVVATIYPLYDVAREVGGDNVQVTCLLPPGASPHTYSPTADDSLALEQAKLVLCVGEGLDDWLFPMLRSGGKELSVVKMMNLVDLQPAVRSGIGEEQKTEESGAESEGKYDPHVWMDVGNMIILAQEICQRLSELDGEHSAEYQRNAELYISQLKKLDSEYFETVGKFAGKKFVAFHSSMTYLAKRYGIIQEAVIEVSPGIEPDPHYLAELIKFIKSNDIAAVLAEAQFNYQLAKTVAEEAGVPLVIIDPIGNPDNPKRDTYIKNMQENLKELEGVLGEKRD